MVAPGGVLFLMSEVPLYQTMSQRLLLRELDLAPLSLIWLGAVNFAEKWPGGAGRRCDPDARGFLQGAARSPWKPRRFRRVCLATLEATQGQILSQYPTDAT